MPEIEGLISQEVFGLKFCLLQFVMVTGGEPIPGMSKESKDINDMKDPYVKLVGEMMVEKLNGQ